MPDKEVKKTPQEKEKEIKKSGSVTYIDVTTLDFFFLLKNSCLCGVEITNSRC